MYVGLGFGVRFKTTTRPDVHAFLFSHVHLHLQRLWTCSERCGSYIRDQIMATWVWLLFRLLRRFCFVQAGRGNKDHTDDGRHVDVISEKNLHCIVRKSRAHSLPSMRKRQHTIAIQESDETKAMRFKGAPNGTWKSTWMVTSSLQKVVWSELKSSTSGSTRTYSASFAHQMIIACMHENMNA